MWPFSPRKTRRPIRRPSPPSRRPHLEALEDRTVPSAVAVPSGILSWWAGDGNAADLVGPNAGTLNNNGVSFSQGKVADGFSFSNSNYVSAPTTNLPTGKTSRTMEMWVKVNNFG